MGSQETAAVGAYGERVAEAHLRAQGMVILDRNWRCTAGELDIVARDGDVLVFCEVKTRRGDRLRLAARGGDGQQGSPAAAARGGMDRASTGCTCPTCGSTWWACCVRRAARRRSSTSEGWPEWGWPGPAASPWSA